MKVTEHVEKLLRQGRKPRQLIKLGFSKTVVTKVHNQLRKEKAIVDGERSKTTTQAGGHLQAPAGSPEKMTVIQQKLQSVEREPQKAENLVKAVPEVATLIVAAQQFGAYRRESCQYQKDGLCTLWMWETEEEIPQGIGEPVFVEGDDWHIKPSPFYCAFCSASLEDRVDDIELDALGTSLWGASTRITCGNCGSKGWIATPVKCTKCGRVTFWGRVPKKE
jgi:hypothetical protein